MNKIIEKYAEEYGYQVADIFSSEVCGHVQPDGFHPPDRSTDHRRSDLRRIAGSIDDRKPRAYCIFKYCTL